MSHEIVGTNGRHVYTMPTLPSDALRYWKFQDFFRNYRGAPFSLQTRDGWSWFSSSARKPALTATFSSRTELDAVIDDFTEDSLSKTFLEGNLDVEGELFDLLAVAEYVLRHSHGLSQTLIGAISRPSRYWIKGFRSNPRNFSVMGGRLNKCPSDLPVDFFQPWLGPSLGHFCAQFHGPNESLEQAQQHTLEKVSAVLKFELNDRLLDMSCGWGSLLVHASSKYGVRGQGMTFCEQQAEIVTERLRQRDLHTQCTAECRTPVKPVHLANAFDKVVDIGLFHQVANSCFRSYLNYTSHALTPGGMSLMHRTTRGPNAVRKSSEFVYGEFAAHGGFPLLSSELQIAESSGYQILNVEDLSSDLQRTLHHWIEQLRRYADPLQETGNRQFRTWLFYLLDIATKLDAGEVQLEQVLLRRVSGL